MVFSEDKVSSQIGEVHPHSEGLLSVRQVPSIPSPLKIQIVNRHNAQRSPSFLPEGNFPPEVITVFLSPLFREFSLPVHLSITFLTSNFVQISNVQAGDRFEKQALAVPVA